MQKWPRGEGLRQSFEREAVQAPEAFGGKNEKYLLQGPMHSTMLSYFIFLIKLRSSGWELYHSTYSDNLAAPT